VVLFDCPQWIVLIWLFLFGAAIGSFLNVCIYRFPQHDRFADQLRALLSPPSSCPRCQNRIPLYDNIPIIGWLKLGGRCRFCRGGISIRYPLIELANGLLFAALYWFGIPGDRDSLFSSLRVLRMRQVCVFDRSHKATTPHQLLIEISSSHVRQVCARLASKS